MIYINTMIYICYYSLLDIEEDNARNDSKLYPYKK